MLLKECPKCGALIPYGRTYCSTCEQIAKAEAEARRVAAKGRANRRYNSKRDPKYSRFYHSKEWKQLSRKRIQDDNYKCVRCGRIACEVDHIIPIQTPDGWTKRFDYDNLQSLCTDCHNAKHDRFQKKRKT